jgi:hypothetical protein
MAKKKVKKKEINTEEKSKTNTQGEPFIDNERLKKE